jgi:uncharacterized membrane protein (DUF4010 family)
VDTIELFQRLGLALAIGFLVGVERGWREREGPAGSRVAGIRTFALIGLLGGIWGALYPYTGSVVLGFAVLAFGIGFTVFQWRESVVESNLSVTTLIAGLVVFALGVFALLGNMAAASAAGVATFALLAEREALHEFLKKVTWPELRAALLLLAMTFVLLPVLPNRNVDPWDALNPHTLWLLTILIAAISYAGYLASRIAGARKGLFYAGAMGGLVSSTAVTLTFSQLARKKAEVARQTAPGIITSWIVSLVRMTAVASAIAPALFVPLVLPVAAAVAVLAAIGFFLIERAADAAEAPQLGLTNPFELGEVLRFGALLAVVMVIAKLLLTAFGQSGLLPLAAVTGLADVDPITLSSARMLGTSLTAEAAALAILVAGGANLVAKAGVAVAVGGPRYGAPLAASAALAIAAGAIARYFLGF